MTSAEYRAAIAALGLNQVTAAKWLYKSVRASHGYANGSFIPLDVEMQLRTPETVVNSVAEALMKSYQKNGLTYRLAARAAIDAYHDYIRRHS